MIRVAGPEPDASEGLRGRIDRLIRRENEWGKWWRHGVVEAGARVDDVDAVYAIMSPYGSAECCAELSRRLGVGWIADMGDPWALDEMMIYPTEVHRRLEIAHMRRLLGTAAAIVMSTPEAARQVADAFPELADRPIVSIPNGYDAADFADGHAAPRDPAKFRIVHTGYLHTELGLQQQRGGRLRKLLGGATPGVEILTRSHVYLLQAVELLLERDPGLRDRLELHFAGVLSEIDRELADRSPVSVLHGYLSHADSIALMRSADLLFLPMQNLPAGRRSTTVPGKTYEYLATGRPILAAVPPGDARDILEQSGRALLCGPDQVDEIAAAIATAIRDPLEGGVDESTARYAYDALAGSVADVIETTTKRHPRGRRSGVTLAAVPEPIDADLGVLHIAYYFPPVGGAGAQRSLKFVRYLPESGCRSVVVTGKGATTGRWTPSDMTLNGEVPDGTVMLRVPAPEPKLPSGWLGRFHRWFRLRSGWSRWWTSGILELAGEAPDVDVILASASPYDTFEAASLLARRLGKPWVAGLRDPWALDEMMIYPTEVHRRLEIAHMRRLLGTAAAIVMTTPEAARQVADAFPELADRPIVSIPNGYDAADFADGHAAPRDPAKFRIVHTGYLHTELGLQQQRGGRLRKLLGGATPGVEILTRSHVYLLQAVELLLERDPGLRDRLELHFAGVLSEIDRELADRSPVSVLHGYLSHADSIALMRSADLLFLPMQNLPPAAAPPPSPAKPTNTSQPAAPSSPPSHPATHATSCRTSATGCAGPMTWPVSPTRSPTRSAARTQARPRRARLECRPSVRAAADDAAARRTAARRRHGRIDVRHHQAVTVAPPRRRYGRRLNSGDDCRFGGVVLRQQSV